MGKTSIEWTDASWNPIVGCTEISPGCANCYAARLAATRLRNHPDYKRLAVIHEGRYVSAEQPSVNCSHWEGQVRFLPERLEEPLHWRQPRRIFVCDMGDLFHESVSRMWLWDVFKTISQCPQHTFQILTKRAWRMREFFDQNVVPKGELFLGDGTTAICPMKNVWLGVSVENQHFADERIPLLLDTPAAVRWISAEPLLGPVKMKIEWMNGLRFYKENGHDATALDGPHLDWVVCGGESGPSARPMHPDWARSLRDQCRAAGVPFFFKQWGSLVQSERTGLFVRTPKKKAGRLLDGREWNEFPQQVTP